MDGWRGLARLAAMLIVTDGIVVHADGGEPTPGGDAIVARLVRPDRQAQEIVRLFDGARWPDPAAALAAWKEQSPDASLGKPVEALIATFNREMIHEWHAIDRAEIRVGRDAATGGIGWLALIPRDDGTVAAGLTAMRLTYPDDRPLALDGTTLPVARLARSGTPLGCQVGTAVILAGSRSALERGAALAQKARSVNDPFDLPNGGDSGTLFRFDPRQPGDFRDGSLTHRRVIEAFRASGCQSVEGVATLADGILRLDLSAAFDERSPADPRAHPRAVERPWLESMTTDGLMAAVSIAIDPDPAAWDRAFAAADRIERVDPARAAAAPLRTRLNLLGLGAGLNLEADLRSHLRGVSACVLGDPARPGRVAGAVVVLHLDDAPVASRLVRQVMPWLDAVLGGDPRARTVAIRSLDRDIRIGWGEGTARLAAHAQPAPGRSLAVCCSGEAGGVHRPPSRVGAFWPGRIWRPAGMSGPAAAAIADDPPVIWRGWDEGGRTRDVWEWPGLRNRVRAFLAAVPGPPTKRAGASPAGESRNRDAE